MNKYKLQQAFQFAAMLLLIGVLQWLTTEVDRSWVSWAVCLPAQVIIVLTSVARLFDIQGMGIKEFGRRVSKVLMVSGTVSMAAAPILGYTASLPSWRAVFLFWGVALMFLTSSWPWHKYISGAYKLKKGQEI